MVSLEQHFSEKNSHLLLSHCSQPPLTVNLSWQRNPLLSLPVERQNGTISGTAWKAPATVPSCQGPWERKQIRNTLLGMHGEASTLDRGSSDLPSTKQRPRCLASRKVSKYRWTPIKITCWELDLIFFFFTGKEYSTWFFYVQITEMRQVSPNGKGKCLDFSSDQVCEVLSTDGRLLGQ